MTTLSELKALAQAATPVDGPVAWPLHKINALQAVQQQLPPDRVLALIAVIEAADALRAAYYDDCVDEHSANAYDAARAALEAK